jgi:hypothetical protein
MRHVRLISVALFTSIAVSLVAGQLAVASPQAPHSATATPAASSGIDLPLGLSGPNAVPLANATFYDRALRSPQWVQIGSGLVYKSCDYSVPNGSYVDSINDKFFLPDGKVETVKPCPYPRLVLPASKGASGKPQATSTQGKVGASAPLSSASVVQGYQQEFYENNVGPIGSLQVDQAAPAKPSAGSANLFDWTGIESSDNSTLLQPILGICGLATSKDGVVIENASTCKYVWMAAYYTWGGNAVAAGVVQVNALDTIEDYMDAESCKAGAWDCTWFMQMYDANTGDASEFTIGTSPPDTVHIGGAYEANNWSVCTDWFSNHHLVWRNLAVYAEESGAPITPSWSKNIYSTACSLSTTDTATSGDMTYS